MVFGYSEISKKGTGQRTEERTGQKQRHLINCNSCLISDTDTRHFLCWLTVAIIIIMFESGITKLLLGQHNPLNQSEYYNHLHGPSDYDATGGMRSRTSNCTRVNIILYPKLSCIIQGLGFALLGIDRLCDFDIAQYSSWSIYKTRIWGTHSVSNISSTPPLESSRPNWRGFLLESPFENSLANITIIIFILLHPVLACLQPPFDPIDVCCGTASERGWSGPTAGM